MQLRVYAMYNRSRKVLALMLTGFAAQAVAAFTIVGTGASRMAGSFYMLFQHYFTLCRLYNWFFFPVNLFLIGFGPYSHPSEPSRHSLLRRRKCPYILLQFLVATNGIRHHSIRSRAVDWSQPPQAGARHIWRKSLAECIAEG